TSVPSGNRSASLNYKGLNTYHATTRDARCAGVLEGTTNDPTSGGTKGTGRVIGAVGTRQASSCSLSSRIPASGYARLAGSTARQRCISTLPDAAQTFA